MLHWPVSLVCWLAVISAKKLGLAERQVMREMREFQFLKAKHAHADKLLHPMLTVDEIPALYPRANYLKTAKSAEEFLKADQGTRIASFQKAAHLRLGAQPVSPKTGNTHPLCASASNKHQTEAIEAFVSTAKGKRIAYSVCGGVYDRMIGETTATAQRIGLDGFFFVCLDQECVDIACELGIFAFLYSAKQPKTKVAEAKFGTAALLSKHADEYIFFEMDIWFKESPLTLLAEMDKSSGVDIQFLSHQECPKCVNIGMYQVYGNSNTASFWDALNQYMQKNTAAFDQQMVQQCVERTYDIVKTKGMKISKTRPPLAEGRLAVV